MLAINMEDVKSVLKLCAPYLIALGVVLVLALAVIVFCKKMPRAKKYLVRSQAILASILAFVLVVNLICFGPMSTLISLATGNGTIKEDVLESSLNLCTEIAEEGFVLLKNDGNSLPMEQGTKLNVFGWSSTNPCYGGTGSGSISGSYDKTTLLQGLEEAGFGLNTELSDFYTAFRAARPVMKTTGANMSVEWTLPEPPVDSYSDELLSNAKAFSDKAVVVISRVGGEGVDLPKDVNHRLVGDYLENSDKYTDFEDGQHYLELSRTETDLLKLVCDNYKDVTVIYNGANTMELGFVEEYPQIKSAVWCPGPGQTGFEALGAILNGSVNPSGKTSDIFVRDLTKTPSFNNVGSFIYDNAEQFSAQAGFAGGGETKTIVPAFINYVEGIYVGYRFYETAAIENLIDYAKEVQYPFGYGLSYTSFTQTMGEPKESDGQISFDVTVTNTGAVAGKDVVQVYYNPPYTNGGIEKAAANLIVFDKTELLEPGASQTLTLSFPLEDMASYDAKGAGCYVLEAGDYALSIRANSHEILAEKHLTQDETVRYDANNKRVSEQVPAVNQFDDVAGNVTYLSRADHFKNYEAATAAPTNYAMSDEAKAVFTNTELYDIAAHNNEKDSMPVTGAKNGLKLEALRGAAYDDPQWDTLLDQLTVAEMDNLIALGGYQTAAIESVDKLRTTDCDGPASINNNFTHVGSIGFPCGVVIASTWNKNLAERFGESIGEMANQLNVSGWYAPAMNGHRSAFAGRNFEYYSEDGLLAGTMAAKAIQGAKKFGVYAYIKHFALNDQETNRHAMLNTWVNEQALREVYLKPFEMAVKEGGAQAVMTAFNYIGATWCGASDALLNRVLRNEWGFCGFALTDYFGRTYFMNADQAIRNGNDAMLVAYDTPTNHVKDQESATSLLAMRQACKNVMYTVVNSRAYAPENITTGPQVWQIVAIVADVIAVVAVIAVELTVVKKGYGKRRDETAVTPTEN
ncbi:MAG: glycoside hydrolase family 3 N-terminal domain-containing protein [Oscillospiraceae bacterium]